ncbi:hypothetical protein LCGC14_3067900 [marine sediment metagenome]|uniref:Uncharacterized protein n=1 Tax=marine sediment metagenome TaxID=412755 RepID=A0A0F8WGW1_9ZZZZ
MSIGTRKKTYAICYDKVTAKGEAMSTKIWIGDKMYLVDEPVREYVDELQAEVDPWALITGRRASNGL